MIARLKWTVAATLVALTLWPAASPVLAQRGEGTVVAEEGKGAELWRDLLHYIRIARIDAAQSNAQALLESGVKPRELYRLSIESPQSLSVLARGAGLTGMKPLIDKIRALIETGAELERSDPDQIGRWLDMLAGTTQQFQIARRRLIESGEYALPQIILKLKDREASETLKERIIAILPKFEKAGVRAFTIALQSKDAEIIETMAHALGEIEYPHAAGRLKEVLERKDLLQRTRRVVSRAIVACAGAEALEKSTAEVFHQQALKYYYQEDSVRPDPRYTHGKVWTWDDTRGVIFKKVPPEIFCEIYAMRMARLALKYQPDFYPAASLWLAAYLKREAELPTGATDPLVGEGSLPAADYALASSAASLQSVLHRALKDGNSKVAHGAIQALANVAGAKSLVKPVEYGATPLVQALSYPEKRVRYLAALALARALPDEGFNGSQLVMPVLTEALRQRGRKTVLLVVGDTQLRNALKQAIRLAGHDVIDEPDVAKAYTAAQDSAGVDVVVLSDGPAPVAAIRRLRTDMTLSALPAVVVTASARTRSRVKTDKRTVTLAVAQAPGIAKAIDQAGMLAAGPAMTPEDAATWARQAAEAIRGLGLTRNRVLDIGRVQGTLIRTLDDPRAEVRTAAAGALAVMSSAVAQRAIVNLAENAEVDEAVRIAAYGSASESVRAFGNQLTDELAGSVVSTVNSKPSKAILRAASQLMGALNLPSEKFRGMIAQAAELD